jgi:hypothetical protein
VGTHPARAHRKRRKYFSHCTCFENASPHLAAKTGETASKDMNHGDTAGTAKQKIRELTTDDTEHTEKSKNRF